MYFLSKRNLPIVLAIIALVIVCASAGYMGGRATLLQSEPTSAIPPGHEQIVVQYKNIAIFLDGKILLPVDDNGEYVKPFIYNGTVYAPVRTVGDALDIEYSWYEPATAVTLTSPETMSVGDISITYKKSGVV